MCCEMFVCEMCSLYFGVCRGGVGEVRQEVQSGTEDNQRSKVPDSAMHPQGKAVNM